MSPNENRKLEIRQLPQLCYMFVFISMDNITIHCYNYCILCYSKCICYYLVILMFWFSYAMATRFPISPSLLALLTVQQRI